MDKQQLHDMLIWLIPVLVILAIWEVIWKVIAMWRSARNNDLAWFICIAFINTLGVLPIVYLVMNRTKKQSAE